MMISKKELKSEYKIYKKYYLDLLANPPRNRSLDEIESYLMSLHSLRTQISLIEYILEIPTEKVFEGK